MTGSGRRGGWGRRAPARPPEDPASGEAARLKAIRLLARRDYPSKGLRDRLEDAGYEADAATEAVASLEDDRYVDDERYAEAAVEGRAARGQGPVRIALELRRQGLDPERIERHLLRSDPLWGERARALRVRRFGAALPADARERARQVRFLLQRGFSGAHVRMALGPLGDDVDLEDAAAGTDAADDSP